MARFLHGLGSPAFPTSIWRTPLIKYWGKFKQVSFPELVGVATEIIIEYLKTI